MIILASSLLSTSSYFKNKPGMATDPHVIAIASYFNSIVTTKSDCIKYVKILQDVMSGKKEAYPEPGWASFDHYTKDKAILYEYENPDEIIVELHPSQLIRMISAFYVLLNEGKSTLMEVEVTNFTPSAYDREFPIPPEVKALPLIKLTDAIPLPPLK